MKCPFVYKNGRRCDGYVSKIRPVVVISLTAENRIPEVTVDSLYPVYLYCSKKGTHSRVVNRRSRQMKTWFDELPTEIRQELQHSYNLKIPEKLKCVICGSTQEVRPWNYGYSWVLCRRCTEVNWYLDKCSCDYIYDEKEERSMVKSVKQVFMKKHGYTEKEIDRVLKRLLPYDWLHNDSRTKSRIS